MVKDWIYAEPLNRYIIVQAEGNVAQSIEIAMEKPAARRTGTALAQALEAYFSTGADGELFKFDFDRSGLTPFRAEIMETLRQVPAGKTVTYGELAETAGKLGAARAVGNVMARNPVPLLVPCHRVVATNGLGGFSGGLDVKRKLLRLEGAV